MSLPDRVLDHLRDVAARPDLSGTGLELEFELGRGGTGVVYAVRDPKLERRVALKVLHAGRDQAERMLAEARIVAGLEHPGIPPVFETGTLVDGRVFYTMRLVEGKPLDQAVTPLTSLSDRLRLFQKVADAIAYAHSHHVIHRDLKPANILVGPFGEVFVMDWAVRQVRGTPGWSAPEQGSAANPSPLADVYSLGVLLAALLPAEAPAALRAIATKASAAEPSRRYQQVADIQDEVRRYLDGERVLAHSESTIEVAVRLYRRHEVLWLLLGAYLAVRFFLFFWSRA